MKTLARPHSVLHPLAGLLVSLWLLYPFSLLSQPEVYDLIIDNARICNGSGSDSFQGSVAVKGDKIVEVGRIGNAQAKSRIDAKGLVLAPGFINMLSWANESLLEDGNGESDLRQGVTLEVMGEGESMGPLSPAMKADMLRSQSDIHYPITWTTLGGYLTYLEKKGISPNVASFVGATTVRVHELGYSNRPPTKAELHRMESLVEAAMKEGALGVASALIYAPGFYAQTPELVALSKVASKYGGMYVSHLRSEGNTFLEAIDELLTICKQANVPGEIYHFKAAGKSNWSKMDLAISKVEQARAAGARITADFYTYTAGATGLDAAMPPWVQEGGYNAWAARLKDPKIRERVRKEMITPTTQWESLYLAAGSPEKVLLVGFKNPALKKYTGRTLASVAAERKSSPEDAAMDLVIEDGSRVSTVYFLMSEENVRKLAGVPWISLCSDEAAPATTGNFLKSNPHPRAYGNFSRFLAKYVREEKALRLEEAVRRLSNLPATNLKITDRGLVKPGYYADLVVFDPALIQDHATFEKPHQYSTGVLHVLVNGIPVLKDGQHTGAHPGRFIKGPGFTGKDAKKNVK